MKSESETKATRDTNLEQCLKGNKKEKRIAKQKYELRKIKQRSYLKLTTQLLRICMPNAITQFAPKRR
jgi:hypothetical protein